MAENGAKQPIIIKKVNKGGHAHHGGAWKIAYADFVTAMMAFFLLLWLLSSVTQEQLEGISNYFDPTDVTEAQFSGSGGLLGGKTVTEEGAATDSITMDLPPPKAGAGSAAALISENEDEQFEEAKQQIEDALQSLPSLKKLAESLMIENTPEGLKIQLIDQDGLALFPSGSAKMYLHTRRLIEVVSKVIMSLPQQISISGHTDAVPFLASGGYSNWELSSDRANSARRELLHFKVPAQRYSRVVGKAATEPLLPDDPKNSRNRRLSIILLRGTDANITANIRKKEEVLPGLNAIKKRQLEQPGTAPAAGQ
ncbi:MAG: flagellar motor protein MotB [Pseudomonadota bacterium]|nr:flagellar motor protein MotB [Pseudomonadota bacterium]